MNFEFDEEWSSIWGRFEPAPEFDYMDEVVRNNVDESFCGQGIWWWSPYRNGITIKEYVEFDQKIYHGRIEFNLATTRPLTDVAFEVGVFFTGEVCWRAAFAEDRVYRKIQISRSMNFF